MLDDNPVEKLMLGHRVLGRDEEEAVLKRYAELAVKHGAESREAIAVRNEIVRLNMKLVVHLAARYRVPSNMDRSDLHGFGVFGLIEAVQRFDVSRGFRFSTYASWWIRHAIGRNLADTASTIRIPVHAQESSRAGTRRDPDEAISERRAHAKARTARDVRAAQNVLSLNAPIASDGDGRVELGDFIGDDSESVLDCMEHEQEVSRVAAAVERLPPKHQAIIRARMADQTLLEVGLSFDEPRSRERVRQLEAEAHAMLRRELWAPRLGRRA